MASSPVKFLFLLLLFCIVGWVVFMFAARLVAWLISRMLGANVGFRIAGCNSLRDVVVKFKKGAVESVSVGEIKLSLRKSLVKLGVGFVSKDPKLQLLICDLEVTLRQSEKKTKKTSSQKSHSSRSSGRGKWMVFANVARFLSVSVTDLVVKMPKAIIEVRDLGLDLFKNGGSNPVLNVKLHLLPLLVHLGESRLSYDQSGCLLEGQAFSANTEKNSAPIICDELLIISELGHDREMGIGLKNVDVTSGVVSININEDMFLKIKMAPDSSPVSDISGGDNTIPQKSQKDKNSVLSLKKHLLVFPEKVSFNLPKLDMRFMHQGQDFCVENNIMGINLRSSKSLSSEDSGESAFYFDIRMDFSEIHLLREGQSSVMEILKVAVVTSVDVPFQLAMPIRTEIDVKLGGTQFNLIVSRLMPLLRLKQSKKSKITLREENYYKESSQVVKTKAIMWTCTVSAPEMTIVLYSLKGLLLYHGCSQSSHLFANNIACKGMQVHAELGELHLHVADEHHECFKENLFGIETNSGSLVHIARVSLDWGHKEMETREDLDSNNLKSIFSVDITGMGIYFNFQHVETLVTTAVSFKSLLRSLTPVRRSSTHSKTGRSNKKGSEGTQIIKLNLEQCSVIFSGDVGIEEAIVADPKRVNYGSQGGEIIFSVSSDGTTRQAHITSTTPDGSKLLKNATSLDIFHLSLTVNKEKQTTQMELERARSFYKEYYREQDPCTTTTLLDIQNAKFVRRPGGLNETSICSLFSATDIAVRWEPDVHVALYELMLRIKFLIHKQKFKGSDSEVVEALEPAKDSTLDSLVDKQHRKKETVFAVDVEMLRVSAELADGVEAMIQVQSIFSENARIGILLEGLGLSFNECRVFKSSRMQISRLPILSPSSIDAKAQVITRWDWVIQGLDIHICMPYRLQLRAIEDAVEDTLRGLKLIITSRANILFPVKDGSKKVKTKASKFGSVRFNIRKLTADIEEEPIQGWLDEHYQLMKSEICELNARLKFLDDTRSLGVETNEMFFGKKIQHGVDIDVQDESAIQKLREEIHEKSFRSYYSACQKLAYSEGSGACRNDFQAGFKPSKNRASLLALCATELDVTLTAIDGADSGMIEFVKKCDAVALDNNIPFSRLYGRDLVLRTGSLVAQLRNYTFPLFSGTAGKCEGRVVFAQQATCFQPQIEQDVYIGKWRKIRMLRSASGTTPAMKMYSNLPIIFQKGELCFGVGFEPVFADISYAFTVALRRANLGFRNPMVSNCQPPKKERSLPWWDDMRYYIHGKIGLSFAETIWNVLATPNPYEKLDKLQIVSGYMDIQQSDGRVHLSAKEFKVFISSLESLISSCSLKNPAYVSTPFLDSPSFSLEVGMDWECDSGNPLDHYLHALPVEGKIQDKVYDPFRSTSLSLKWNFSLKPSPSQCDKHDTSSSIADGGILHGAVYGNSQKSESALIGSPKMNLGAHDLVWLLKFWNMNYNPPHKLRSFSRWPRFGVPRAARSGNLSLDKVMTEFFLRLDSTPASIRHMPLGDDDPASGLTFTMTKMKYELCFSRGKQRFTFDCKREPLDLVYQGLDMHLLKAYLNRDADKIHQDSQSLAKNSQSAIADRINSGRSKSVSGCADKSRDVGFLLHSDFFSIRKQAPKADPARLLAWQDPGRRNLEMTYVRSEFENGSESDHAKSDPSDDDGFNVVIADNCQRVFVYGLKLLWTLENRDAVWSWVGGISKAFEPPKPSPSRQYAQRRLAEEQQIPEGSDVLQDDLSNSLHSSSQGANPSSPQNIEVMASHSSGSPSTKMEISSGGIEKDEPNGVEEEGTRHFMVNVVQPQFNLHSEEANGRFLLAAASGRVLARSFHSIVHVGYEMIEKTLGTSVMKIPESEPEMTWKRAEFSVMLEHVQSHVAPTDVDPGAGLQWLPKIRRHYPEVKRTGALLERVFMPCQMYFRYTRHKGASADLKVKPLKELTFNSPNITATMTSRQFQVMLDVLSNLLFARLPKPRKNNLSYPNEDDDFEEADEVVPDGVEEVELARIKLEQNERDRRLLVYDIRTILSSSGSLDISSSSPEKESNFWMITGGRSTLVQGLKKELASTQKSKKAASIELRMALQKAAQLHLMEKEKNKSPSYAMRISMKINKVVWSMISDGKLFAEAEINNMVYDFDRDYKDIGVAKFTTKSFEVRNCMPNTKSGMLLAPWNAPPEWGKNVMLRVDAKQGAPKDGSSRIEKFQVEIHPLRIHLTETMYRMMWEYFFPEEEQDSHRRQEVWKVSTTAGSRRSRKSASGSEFGSSNHSVKESEAPSRLNATTSTSSASGVNASHAYPDSQVSKLQNLKANIVCGSTPELRRTSSFDRTWEENVAESVADEIVLQIHSSSKSGPLDSTLEHPYSVNEKTSKVKPKDSKSIKLGRLSHEEKKIGKSQDEKRVRVRKMMEFHDIKIGQVELLVTYEGSRFPVNDLRLLMDTFHQDEFTGTWRRLFSRVKKHIIWGVLKSVTGMQGKKFKDKAQSQRETSVPSVPSIDLNFSDSDGDQPGKSDEYPISWLKRPNDGAGDGFVTSIKGLFNSQRRRAKAFVLRTMRGDQDSEFQGEWSESDAEFSPFARQLTITKARKLIRHHTKKFRSRGQKASGSASQQRGSLPSSPRETPFQSDSSGASSPYEDFHE